MSLATLIKFRDVGYLLVILALVAVVQTMRASLAGEKNGLLQAYLGANIAAQKLSDELVIEQAKAMAITNQKATIYVDRIRAAPDDAARNRAGSVGVRDIVRGSDPKAVSGTAPAVPGPGLGGGPR